MIFSIAGLVFNSVKGTGFDAISRTKKGEYAELKLANGAMSQLVGRSLDKLSFTALWVGLDAAATITDLDELLTGHHQVSDQDGINYGLWTLDSYTDNGSDIMGGALICHKVTLNLTEYR